MMRSVASVCLKLSNLTILPCFRTFFQLHHNQSSILHPLHLKKKNCCLLFLSFLSLKLFLHNYNAMTASEM